ncbi:MAG: 4-hydroxy-tetrahydrodipicolinate synthase [Gemmatimonadetes bacterium]|nr:4-hydroxy-tetrahydrodipicolinate synthase [Gemmatimonadota bacterium]
MDVSRFRGLAVALVTPFREDGSVDQEAFEEHVEAMIAGGVDVLVPCGTTGESATLDAAEQRALVRAAVRVAAGRVPVMAGAGANDTRKALALAGAAVEEGADALLVVCPYYNKPTQEGLYRHFEAIARSVDVPVCVYNVPGRTASNLRPETMLRLAELENICGIKEASGDLGQVMSLVRDLPHGFLVLSGDDELTLPILALGGDGVISVIANEAPGPMAELVRAGLVGDFESARRIHYRLLPLMRANFVESNPIPVKSALEMLGRMRAHFRLPLTPISDAGARTLRAALEAAGLVVQEPLEAAGIR